jgi:tetratricopeptide (TPR) repeat protein
MNKIYFPMLALAAGLAFTSCEDQLDIVKKGAIPSSDFYKNDADCEKALAAAYEGFDYYTVGRTDWAFIYTPAKVVANHPGDDVNYGGGNYGDHEFGGSLDEFRYRHTPDAIDFHYKGLYLSVYKDNLVLDYYANPATDFQRQAVAEARVLRAYNFFLLACYWGQPPFVDHLLDADVIPTNSEMTQKEYYVWVAQQCEEAVPDLKERESTADKNGAYRVTKGFANALAGKAYMFAGEYEKAKVALKKVIDSNKYDLVSGDQYMDLFHVEGDGCPEKVFEVNLKYNPTTKDWEGSTGGYLRHTTWMECQCFNWRAGNFKANPASKYTGGIDGWGSIGATEWFSEDFHNNDGDSKRFKATLMHIDDAVYQTSGLAGMSYAPLAFDPAKVESGSADEAIYNGLKKYWVTEKDGTVTIDLNKVPAEDLKNSKAVGISDIGQGLYGQSFYLPIKHLVRGSDVEDGGSHAGNARLNNIIVMRYAEVLLNYAECCLQTNDPGEAKKYINKIQQRAGSKTISDNVDMEVLKKEKAYELWFEGCRFQDILRWNDQAGIARLKQAGSAVPHLFDKLFRPVGAGETPVWEHGTEANSRFYIIHTHEAKDAGFEVGFQEKHRLFPYPQSIMEQNPEIKQNPGWE